MNAFVSDPNKPRLGVGIAFQKLLRCGKDVIGHFKGFGLDINRHDFSTIGLLVNLRPHFAIVDFISTTGVFFFRISSLSIVHWASSYAKIASIGFPPSVIGTGRSPS